MIFTFDDLVLDFASDIRSWLHSILSFELDYMWSCILYSMLISLCIRWWSRLCIQMHIQGWCWNFAFDDLSLMIFYFDQLICSLLIHGSKMNRRLTSHLTSPCLRITTERFSISYSWLLFEGDFCIICW